MRLSDSQLQKIKARIDAAEQAVKDQPDYPQAPKPWVQMARALFNEVGRLRPSIPIGTVRIQVNNPGVAAVGLTCEMLNYRYNSDAPARLVGRDVHGQSSGPLTWSIGRGTKPGHVKLKVTGFDDGPRLDEDDSAERVFEKFLDLLEPRRA